MPNAALRYEIELARIHRWLKRVVEYTRISGIENSGLDVRFPLSLSLKVTKILRCDLFQAHRIAPFNTPLQPYSRPSSFPLQTRDIEAVVWNPFMGAFVATFGRADLSEQVHACCNYRRLAGTTTKGSFDSMPPTSYLSRIDCFVRHTGQS